MNVAVARWASVATIAGGIVANKFGIYSWAAVLPASGTIGIAIQSGHRLDEASGHKIDSERNDLHLGLHIESQSAGEVS